MGEIVNLRQFRKAKERKDAERQAEINRLTFGRTKGERETTKAERERDATRLDGHRLESADPTKDE
jgi:hypothetical protein